MSKVSTSSTLWFQKYSVAKILKVKVTSVRSKSYHDIAHLQTQPNYVPIKYELPITQGVLYTAHKVANKKPIYLIFSWFCNTSNQWP